MRALIFVSALIAASTLTSAAFAEPVAYRLDPRHTQVGFSVDRFGFNRVLGRFDAVSGEMVIDEAAPARSSVNAVVQMSSYNSGDTRPPGPECANPQPAPPAPPQPGCGGGRDEHLRA